MRSRLSTAKALGWVATVGVGLGIGGAIVALLAPDQKPPMVDVTASARGVAVQGSF